MIAYEIIDSIIELEDEKGGDNATDGFEFQMSNAIYLLFTEMLENKQKNRDESILVYEKVEDFIIFNNSINLYQAKSTNRSLTPNLLYSPTRKTKSDDSGLPIIEKMNLNYLKVKDKVSEIKVYTTLIICENQKFSKKISKTLKGIEDLRKINFSQFSEDAKIQIINNTKFNEYDWENFYAQRIIPKNRHEEVTRAYIEDVVTKIFGENKINSAALYTSLTYEIKKIRKNKTRLSTNFLIEKINKFCKIEGNLKFNDCNDLLNEEDKRNLIIAKSFSQIQNKLMIKNHPIQNDYNAVRDLLFKYDFKSIDQLYEEIINSSELKLIRTKLSEHELKALLLIVVVKEVIM